MVEVVTDISIERPIKEVVEFASNPDNAARWYGGIKLVKWKSSPPLKVDAELAFVVNFLGEIAVNYRIVGLSDRHLEMITEDEGFPSTTRYEWEEIDVNCTKMVLRNIIYPCAFTKILIPVKSLMLKRSNLQDLERLKKILEGRY